MTDITYEFIEKSCNELLISGGVKKAGLSPKTVSDVLALIRSILKFAIRKGNKVPCDGRAIQIRQRIHPIKVLSKKDQERLCRYLYDNFSLYNMGILICLFTGLRIGEICALRWEDISFPENTIYVHQTLQRIQYKENQGKRTKVVITAPKSVCSNRRIPLPEILAQILISHKVNAGGYVLTGHDSIFIEPRTLENHFKKALRDCNIEPVNFHVTRHTFATRCVELGFDIKSLSEILGHANVNITMNRYVHPTFELKKENMQKLSVLLTVK